MPVRIILAAIVAASAALAGDIDMKSLDTNHDGKIDQAELQPFLKAMNHYNGDADGVLGASGGTVILRTGTTPAEFRLMPGAGGEGPSPIAQAADHIRGILREFLGYLMKKDQPDQMERLAMQMVKAELKFAQAEIQYRAGHADQAMETLWSIVPADQREGDGAKMPPHHEAPTSAQAPPKHEEHPELAQLDAERGKITHRIHELKGSIQEIEKAVAGEDVGEDRRAMMKEKAAALGAELDALQAQSAKIAERMAVLKSGEAEQPNPGARIEAALKEVRSNISKMEQELAGTKKSATSDELSDDQRAQIEKRMNDMQKRLEDLRKQRGYLEGRLKEQRGGK